MAGVTLMDRRCWGRLDLQRAWLVGVAPWPRRGGWETDARTANVDLTHITTNFAETCLRR